jgi:hypothetical protein
MDVPWRVARLTSEMGVDEEIGLFNGLVPGRCLEQGLRELLRGLGLMTEGGVLVLRSGKKRPHSEKEEEKEDSGIQQETKLCTDQETSQEMDQAVPAAEAEVRLVDGLAPAVEPEGRLHDEQVGLQAMVQGNPQGDFREVENVTRKMEELRVNARDPTPSVDIKAMTVDKGQYEEATSADIKATTVAEGQNEGLRSAKDIEAASLAENPSLEGDNPNSDKKHPNSDKGLEAERSIIGDVKATKADDAAVRVEDWDRRLCRVMSLDYSTKVISAAVTLRKCCLGWYRRKVTQSYFWWLHHSPKFQQCGVGMGHVVELDQCCNPQDDEAPATDLYRWAEMGRPLYCDWWSKRFNRHRKEFASARDVIRRFGDASWWDWDGGSRPVHWKWPKWYQTTIQFGLPVWFREAPDQWRRPQGPGRTKAEHEQMKIKLNTVRTRRYVEPGEVVSLTSFFAVPKGTEDIRMVYDGTKSGLNNNIWVPRFPLPIIDTHLRAVDGSTFMSDMDIGEMFLNFILHESMQALCGVDLSSFFGELDEAGTRVKLWERWTRAAMGLKSSPYQSVQAMLVAKEVIKGDRLDPNNAFRWDKVRLNLPGSRDYDPSISWVSKIRVVDNTVAADIFIYVNDARITGPTEEECWAATRQAASRVNSLGIQEAARKRRWPSRKQGAWAGSIVETTEEGVFVTVSQEKWDKCRKYIGEIVGGLVSSGDNTLEFKALERKRGFLIYVTRTYPAMVPYLKGMHQTLDSWRDNRGEDGWKMTAKEIAGRMRSSRGEPGEDRLEEAPARVKAAPRFESDMEALPSLFESVHPPKRLVRSYVCLTVFYRFGDASGVGHADNFQGFRNVAPASQMSESTFGTDIGAMR